MGYIRTISIQLGAAIVSWLVASGAAYWLDALSANSLKLTVGVASVQSVYTLRIFWKMQQTEKRLRAEKVNFTVSDSMLAALVNAQMRFSLLYPWVTTFVLSFMENDSAQIICGVAAFFTLPHFLTLVRLYRQASTPETP